MNSCQRPQQGLELPLTVNVYFSCKVGRFKCESMGTGTRVEAASNGPSAVQLHCSVLEVSVWFGVLGSAMH